MLARALRHSLHTHTGASDYTWQRPARRQDPDDTVIRPAPAAPAASITVVLDTSDSMGRHQHAKAFSEINAILTKAVPHPCRVDPPQVGNFSDQNWGISVIAVNLDRLTVDSTSTLSSLGVSDATASTRI